MVDNFLVVQLMHSETCPFRRAQQMNVISNMCSYSLAMSLPLFERESQMAVAARRSCIEWSRPFAPHLMSYTIESCLAFVKPAAAGAAWPRLTTKMFVVVTAFLVHCPPLLTSEKQENST